MAFSVIAREGERYLEKRRPLYRRCRIRAGIAGSLVPLFPRRRGSYRRLFDPCILVPGHGSGDPGVGGLDAHCRQALIWAERNLLSPPPASLRCVRLATLESFGGYGR